MSTNRRPAINFRIRLPLLLAAVSAAVSPSVASESPHGNVLVEWRFDKDARGWAPNAHLRNVAVRGGALCGEACGNDPLLVGPVFEIPATPLQWVEISMKSTARAPSELFWTETLEGKFGGFSEKKHRLYYTIGDGQYHAYRIYPFWQAAKKIIRLRVDPPNEGRFEIRSIRVMQGESRGPTAAHAWKADEMKTTWQRWTDVSVEENVLCYVSPLTSIPADDNAFVCVRLSAEHAGSVQLMAISKSQFGSDSTSFALRPDGKLRTYNIDAGALKTWTDSVIMLGIKLPAAANVHVESIEVARDPRGPAELELSYFGPTEGINRAGRSTGVTCTLKNLGGDPAENVVATLEAPAGVRILDEPRKTLGRLSLLLPKTASWQVQADRPGLIELALRVEGPRLVSVGGRTSIELSVAPSVPHSSYVPEPRPVRSKYEIGAFYFPGWSTSARWEPIRTWPNRKPILGWYDEANPECADWQIKWAVEHGISFFMVDWYWNQGHQHLEHWVHDAFSKARYRSYLKWAVMWANHNPPHSHSPDDWRKVTQYWIDNYFGMPDYYRIDNRPAVFLWSPQGVRRDVGGSEAVAKLYAMSQEMAHKAGYPGIYFVAMSSHDTPEQVKELEGEGFKALTTYHGFQLAHRDAKNDYFPYKAVVNTAREVWRQEDDRAQGLVHMPIVDTGWDPRPWHGDKTTVALGRTPQLLGQLCRQAREFADATGKRFIALGPWNEWGEGSYIEPYAEYGFQDLDAIRAAFCEPGDWPPNLIPADVGRGPYDLPAFVAKNAWEFNTPGDLESWSSNGQIENLTVRAGMLSGRSTGDDPLLIMSSLQVEADRMHHVSFRFRADKAGQVQLYWSTTLKKMSGQTCININVPGDGLFHDYEIDLAKHPQWRGIVNSFRFDPAIAPGVSFAIDYIRLH